MKIAVIPASTLCDSEAAAWDNLRSADSNLDSPFFSPEFTRAVGQVRNDVEIAILQRGDQTVGFFPFQRRSDNTGQPVGGPLSGFHGLVLRADQDFDAYQLLHGCELSAWHFRQLVAGQSAFRPYCWYVENSACIDTSMGFDAYCRQRRLAGSETVPKTMQKLRKLEREVGPVRFEFDTKDPSVLDAMMSWKSAQLDQAGEFNLFSLAWTRQLFARLLARDSIALRGTMSAIYVADELQAALYCLRSNRVLHAWIAAYSPKLAKYSPGYQLFTHLIRSANSRGIDRIDLGRGDERFKSNFANSAIPLAAGSVDSRPAMRTMRWAWYCSRHRIGHTRLRRAAAIPWRLIRRVQDPARYW